MALSRATDSAEKPVRGSLTVAVSRSKRKPRQPAIFSRNVNRIWGKGGGRGRRAIVQHSGSGTGREASLFRSGSRPTARHVIAIW